LIIVVVVVCVCCCVQKEVDEQRYWQTCLDVGDAERRAEVQSALYALCRIFEAAHNRIKDDERHSNPLYWWAQCAPLVSSASAKLDLLRRVRFLNCRLSSFEKARIDEHQSCATARAHFPEHEPLFNHR
jgi:hypothetical protein